MQQKNMIGEDLSCLYHMRFTLALHRVRRRVEGSPESHHARTVTRQWILGPSTAECVLYLELSMRLETELANEKALRPIVRGP